MAGTVRVGELETALGRVACKAEDGPVWAAMRTDALGFASDGVVASVVESVDLGDRVSTTVLLSSNETL